MALGCGAMNNGCRQAVSPNVQEVQDTHSPAKELPDKEEPSTVTSYEMRTGVLNDLKNGVMQLLRGKRKLEAPKELLDETGEAYAVKIAIEQFFEDLAAKENITKKPREVDEEKLEADLREIVYRLLRLTDTEEAEILWHWLVKEHRYGVLPKSVASSAEQATWEEVIALLQQARSHATMQETEAIIQVTRDKLYPVSWPKTKEWTRKTTTTTVVTATIYILVSLLRGVYESGAI